LCWLRYLLSFCAPLIRPGGFQRQPIDDNTFNSPAIPPLQSTTTIHRYSRDFGPAVRRTARTLPPRQPNPDQPINGSTDQR
jgi:hypothetical protein